MMHSNDSVLHTHQIRCGARTLMPSPRGMPLTEAWQMASEMSPMCAHVFTSSKNTNTERLSPAGRPTNTAHRGHNASLPTHTHDLPNTEAKA
jgi:hypothetical protein